MAKGTPATLALEKAGIAFTLYEYDYDPNAARIGMQAAQALGIEPARLLKTLMAKILTTTGQEVVCVLLASDREVNLEEARRGSRREKRSDGRGPGGRAHHRLSRRRHFRVRPEKARAHVYRQGRAGVSEAGDERRPARVAGRARRRRCGEACSTASGSGARA